MRNPGERSRPPHPAWRSTQTVAELNSDDEEDPNSGLKKWRCRRRTEMVAVELSFVGRQGLMAVQSNAELGAKTE
ncbi:hypothetical protein I3842_Q119500 [Carya illinoinensis]|uniref:Uncharacterized protein n=1 Tax=Carya illinoinensis TaxID=32201 RepID=A0A921ZXR3_CARIL|nr:hypothetical protein I3842_Q119500 [Carya illinoinensis]